jgi:outer membrane lipoprotein SlyB
MISSSNTVTEILQPKERKKTLFHILMEAKTAKENESDEYKNYKAGVSIGGGAVIGGAAGGTAGFVLGPPGAIVGAAAGGVVGGVVGGAFALYNGWLN